MSDQDDDEDYFLPVEDQRVFGAGIRRKRIAFVPATSSESALPTTTARTSNSASAESRYLSIVLPKSNSEKSNQKQNENNHTAAPVIARDEQTHLDPATVGGGNEDVICPVCKQPIVSTDGKPAMEAHEASIAHQVCLEHSHPPSHLDREHVGLRYLETYGWNPDSRKGLGARQEGIRIPIKPKEKKDTAGLRETLEDEDHDIKTIQRKARAKKEDKVVRLNAKQVRIKDMEAKKKAEKLRRVFYGGQDLEQYLGPNG
ncbi:hypothetical protein HRR83_007638 [Exophiala dermatitidis]|uniref:G-patch domain-containing protein n=2 Tax=Exophiala dermatitidis TaxID=5970 RepID=H6BLB8_EXODN|nr:uncharacterized protein HMPREF1120_01018 [Exophiala dermatitidis NIH/UT8656]KAJ4507830.1 hypothetical protein HRR75_006540 [Exophiala dermatitidis]EHY52811.1 hypothetical protein HMPREF1120_01018 [Exophiala dermatitidis NIH/UT8656]KAJ4509972.1 hypothetical protein HRR74_007124 [Exophiala dermatitidis]KAJ4521776.1 hypothetical protein HRR73_002974 [Exophiala dermatitidis]KAJ4539470.1 hypothetical protein HRR77_006354 [Exophiala dermatitidis]